MGLSVRYLLAIALAALATGIQVVLLPWLAVGELQLPASQVGWVQSAVLLPGVLFMLWAGAMADRPGAVRWLPGLYGGLLLCHAGMLWLVLDQALRLPLLISYALLLGALQALIQPLRDRALPHFMSADGSFQNAVVQISLCVYIAQALGVSLAGQVAWLGLAGVLACQCLALLLCMALLSQRLRQQPMAERTEAVQNESGGNRQLSVADGLRFVARRPILRQLVALVAFNGFIHIGVFVVALPLLARDVFQRDAAFFATLQLVFVVGNIVATLVLLRRGRIRYQGRSVLFCLLYAGVIMLAIGAGPTTTGLLLLIFVWGVVAGVSASLGKALLQQQVLEDYRGRVLSIYHLALFGAAPLGALACGYAVQYWGALRLFELGGLLSLGLFAVFLCLKPLWQRY